MGRQSLLDRILAAKQEEVAMRQRRFPRAALQSMAQQHARREFIAALQSPGPLGVNVIAEVKRASPSKGELMADCDPAALSSAYEKAGAACLSVLTDEIFFKASPGDLKAARSAVTLPVLRKDFIVSLYQVYESAAMGADAILLIAAALSDAFIKDALALAKSVGLDVLLEVHNEAEMERAVASGASLIGINNRDLTRFVTDIQTTLRLAPLLPEDRAAVCESGIRTRKDVVRIRNGGVFNFLIGEALVTSKKPGAKLAELLGAGKSSHGSDTGKNLRDHHP